MSASATDPFAAALAQIEASLPHAPYGYRYRIVGQWALCGLLILSSLVFLTFHFLHAWRTQRGLWLVRLPKKSGTRFWHRQITINSIPFFATVGCLSAMCLTLAKWKEWDAYVENKGLLTTLASFFPWLVVFIQAWAFSLTNLEATLTARQHLSAKNGTAVAVWAHNLALLGGPILVFGLLVPMCAILSARQTKLAAIVLQAVALLRQASADVLAGQPVDLAPLLELEQKQAALTQENTRNNYLQSVLCILCMVFVIVVTLMNIYSLFLVVILRRHVKAIHSRRSQSDVPLTFTRQFVVSVDSPEAVLNDVPEQPSVPAVSLAAPISPATAQTPFSTFHAHTHSRSPYQLSANEQALERLASDLSYSVPLTIIMCCIILASLSIFVARSSDLTRNGLPWNVLEFCLDSFTYTYLVMNILVTWFFSFNLYKSTKSERPPELPAFVKSPDPAASKGEIRVTFTVPSQAASAQEKAAVKLEEEAEKESDEASQAGSDDDGGKGQQSVQAE